MYTSNLSGRESRNIPTFNIFCFEVKYKLLKGITVPLFLGTGKLVRFHESIPDKDLGCEILAQS